METKPHFMDIEDYKLLEKMVFEEAQKRGMKTSGLSFYGVFCKMAEEKDLQNDALASRVKELEEALTEILDVVYDSDAPGTYVSNRWMGLPSWEVFDNAKELVTK